MRVFFKLSFLAMVLLMAAIGAQASGSPRRDSLTNEEIIKFGLEKLAALVKNNRIHEVKGNADSLNYVLNINTLNLNLPGLFDTYPNAEFIKQQRPTNVSMEVAPYILDPSKLSILNQELVTANQQQQIKTYMLLVNFVPLVLEDTSDFKTISDVFVKLQNDRQIGNQFKKDSLLLKKSLKQGADIVKGITKGFIDTATQKMIFLGWVKFVTLYKKKRFSELITIYYPNSKLLATETGYRNILKRNIDGEIFSGTADQEVEKMVNIIKKTNELYSSIEELNGNILNINSPDTMEQKLSDLFGDAYAIFEIETRMHILKVLSSREIPDSRETLINDIVATTPMKDYDFLINRLQDINDKAPDTIYLGTFEGNPIKRKNDKYLFTTLNTIIYNTEDAECWFCWGEDNYQRLIQNLLIIYGKTKQYKHNLVELYSMEDSLFNSRKIIWDRDYFLSVAPKQVGTFEPEVDYDYETGIIKYKIKKLDHITWTAVTVTDPDNEALKYTVHTPHYHYTYAPEVEVGPFEMITFTDRADLSMLSAVVEKGQKVMGNNAISEIYAPALLLQYADDKRWNKNAFKAIELGLNVLTLVIPGGQVAYLGRTINFIYKTIDYAAKVAAALNILRNANVFQQYEGIEAFIDRFDKITGMLGLVQLGGSIAEIFKNAKYQRAIRKEAEDYFRDFYKAEKSLNDLRNSTHELYKLSQSQMDEILSFSQSLEDMGKAAGYGDDWIRNIRRSILESVGFKKNKVFDELFVRWKEKINVITDPSGVQIIKDVHGNNIMHLSADGKTLYIDAVGNITTEEGKVLQIIDDEVFVPNGASNPIKDDIVLFEKTNGDIVCIMGACFVKGTPVHTKNGLKGIESIKEGEIVLSYDEKSGKNGWQKVRSVFSKQVEKLVKVAVDSETIRATPEHPFYTEQGWKSAKELVRGMRVRLTTGAMAAIMSVTAFDSSATVYNFEVDSTHTYYVGSNGALVHNDCSIINKLSGKIEGDFLDDFIRDFSNPLHLQLLKEMERSPDLVRCWNILAKHPTLRIKGDLLTKVDQLLKGSAKVPVDKLIKAIEKISDGIPGFYGIERSISLFHKFKDTKGFEKVIANFANEGFNTRRGAGYVMKQAENLGVDEIAEFENIYASEARFAADFKLKNGTKVDCKSWDPINSVDKIPTFSFSEQFKSYFKNPPFEMWFDLARIKTAPAYAAFEEADAILHIKNKYKTKFSSNNFAAYDDLANSAYLVERNITTPAAFEAAVNDINSSLYQFVKAK